jgi:hypothetical protein
MQVGGTVVGTGTVTPAGTFSVTFFGPTTPGTYPLVVTFTPSPGSNTGGGSYVTSLAVGNGTGSNSPGLTISFGNGAGSGAQRSAACASACMLKSRHSVTWSQHLSCHMHACDVMWM